MQHDRNLDGRHGDQLDDAARWTEQLDADRLHEPDDVRGDDMQRGRRRQQQWSELSVIGHTREARPKECDVEQLLDVTGHNVLGIDERFPELGQNRVDRRQVHRGHQVEAIDRSWFSVAATAPRVHRERHGHRRTSADRRRHAPRRAKRIRRQRVTNLDWNHRIDHRSHTFQRDEPIRGIENRSEMGHQRLQICNSFTHCLLLVSGDREPVAGNWPRVSGSTPAKVRKSVIENDAPEYGSVGCQPDRRQERRRIGAQQADEHLGNDPPADRAEGGRRPAGLLDHVVPERGAVLETEAEGRQVVKVGATAVAPSRRRPLGPTATAT